jgi:hypothetical protein
MSYLHILRKLMPPPESPADVPTRDAWQSVERNLGMELPEDYKGFIGIYGTGAVDGFLWVFTPFTGNSNLNLLDQAKLRLDAQRDHCQVAGVRCPYALFPDANGLFPWGASDNGDVLYWLCKDSPPRWITVVCDPRASEWREVKLSTSQFLAVLLTRQLVVDLFPQDFPSELPQFVRA